ncbi:MAG: 16S rRNA (cytosine(967)-C(5))-methyltransferase RsmB [Verrucomicrobia bacterium]|nr:16S rRNA (cytosine(967)-C(5))-methyltransferase RsmB [Verrucomicrobiota bacterium]
MKKKNSRLVAAEILTQWFVDRRFPDRELAKVEHDNAFVMEVVNGVVRNRNILQWLEQGMVPKEPEPFFKAVLYVGLYQLLFMDNVEEYAAISETVEAAKGRPGGPGNAKMINAVLRRAQRESEDIFRELKRQPDNIRLSHPDFLLERWRRQFGEIEARKLAEWNNHPPQTILRVEQAVISAPEFEAKLAEAGIELEPHPFSDREKFYILPRGLAVRQLPGYAEGWFTVQDPATSIAIDLLRPFPGESVLDACAAPGGKTAMVASRMKGEGELVAMDLHDDRMAVLKENMGRLGLDWVELVQGDARDPQKALGDRKFDAILLDVPCLNTGVLRRRIDARWRVNTNRIKSIVEIQYELLSACTELLKENGRIVYSTCSLEPEENEDLIARWVREHPGFNKAKAKKTFPPKTGTDDAFAAVIRRD